MKTTNIIIRDDDVNVYTCIHEFKKLHQRFIEAGKVHTVAVIMKDLWENHSIFYYLATAPLLEIGLHGWEHKDYSQLSYNECYEDVKKALNYWEENTSRMVGKTKKITTFFAPWNREGESIKKACEDLGLRFCAVRKGQWEGKEIRSFHHWSSDNYKI
ncbi:MAG: polysaccharide deacetylase family protein [Candidatus Hodarchaeales archaeon]